MLFVNLARYLEVLEATPSRLQMTRVLAELFKESQGDEIAQIVYLLQGSVVPQYERLEFGLAERLVFKAFVSSFSLNEKEARKQVGLSGDLGKTVEAYRRTNVSLFAKEADLPFATVFLRLKDLAGQTGVGSQEYKLSILSDLFQKLDPLSCRYLVRIVVGSLRLGFSDMTILDALSWLLKGDKSLRLRIERAFNVRPDLGLLAKLVKEGKLLAIDKIEPIPGVPILMAKAERVKTIDEIIEKIGPCSIEPKYDGFRLQVHKLANGEVKIYSRNLDNVVAMFPDLVAAMQNDIEAKSCIIEGEAVGYDPKTNKILPFQEIVQRKRKHNIEQKAKEIPLKLFAFDLLYHQKSFLEVAYRERRAELRGIINKNSQTILLSQDQPGANTQTITTLFEKAVGEGLEGIMAKKLTGKYEAGARGWNWIKVKHSYSQNLIDTLDCLVMGYDLGKGKRTQFGLGAFLVGVFDEANERFVTVAKVGTGLTDEEWRVLKTKTSGLTLKEPPASYFLNKNLSCDIWLKPQLVVEIRADEISHSPSHTALLALRFPRLERFRDDKNPQDITTLRELTDIYQKQHKSSLSQ
jgi:DNA ligase-1